MNLIVPNWIIILMYATVTLLTIPRNKKFALIATELAGCGQKGQVCGSAPRPTTLVANQSTGHRKRSQNQFAQTGMVAFNSIPPAHHYSRNHPRRITDTSRYNGESRL
jgi:hypothetical protein